MKKVEFTDRQRMQLKALACLLGLVLLALLLVGRALVLFFRDEGKLEPIPIPVARTAYNVWVLDAGSRQLKVFEDGEERLYAYGEGFTAPKEAKGQIADLELVNDCVVQIHTKEEKISGKVLTVYGGMVEVEGYGRLPLSGQVRGYRLYQSLSMCTASDLAIGYASADFVLEEGEICGILIAREESMDLVRVLLKNSGYQGLFHKQVDITCDTGFTVRYGEAEESVLAYQAGQTLSIEAGGPFFTGSRVKVVPDALTGKLTLTNVERSQGSPSYRGSLELSMAQEGMVVINELPLEEYLYSVVPSEMPASYPMEALKSQAICARTYAYARMLHAGYPQYGAHVDDSTGYQVYNNILEQEASTAAVKETYGLILFEEDGATPAQTYYYSTSCGIGSDLGVWGTQAEDAPYLSPKPISRSSLKLVKKGEDPSKIGKKAKDLMEEGAFRAFITQKDEEDYEWQEAWYRWTYTVEDLDGEALLSRLKERCQANASNVLTLKENGEYESGPIPELGDIEDLYVASRGAGGIANELVVQGQKATVKVLTEYNIRCILNDGKTKVVRQDGSESSMPSLLPSAYFVIDLARGNGGVQGYQLTGGGFGHGVGLSQNGAKDMALDGHDAEDILRFFYYGCTLMDYRNGD